MNSTWSQELDPAVFDDLLQAALARRSGQEANALRPYAEQIDLMVHLLDVIDDHWTVSPEVDSKILAAFSARIRAEYGEDWDHLRPVSTLGDLVEARGGELPTLAQATLQQLKSDQTPIGQLKDPRDRKRAVGIAVLRANVPKTLVADFINWISHVLDETTSQHNAPNLYVVPCPQ